MKQYIQGNACYSRLNLEDGLLIQTYIKTTPGKNVSVLHSIKEEC